MSLSYYYGTLSASPPLSAVGVFVGGRGTCTNLVGQECTNVFPLTATPVGGSGVYSYEWVLINPPAQVVLEDDTFATATLRVTRTVGGSKTVEVKVTVTDTRRSWNPPVSETVFVDSEHVEL